MNESSHDQRFARRAAEQLSRNADAVDDATRVRLRAARRRALDALDDRPGIAARFGVPAVAALAAAVLATVLLVPRWNEEPPQELVAGLGLEDLELLGGAEDLELYEHLEFYRWLEASEPI